MARLVTDQDFSDEDLNRRAMALQELADRGKMTERQAAAKIELLRRQRAGIPQKTLSERVGGFVEGVKKAIVGDPNQLPELPQSEAREGDFFSIQDKLATARGNPLGQAQILQEMGLPVDFDEKGRPFTTLNGKSFSINREGFSPSDLTQFLQEAAVEVAGAKGAGQILKPLGKVGRVLGAGVGAGGGSALIDKTSQILGSDQPVDQKRAALAALFGSGGEAGSMVFEKLIGKIGASRALSKDGQITERGAKLLQEAGIDPNIATPEFLAVFEGRAVSPQQAARLAEAQSLDVPVRLSKGDVTQSPRQQARESQLEAGVEGEEAETIARQFRQDQQGDLLANRQALQANLGGQVTERGRGAEIALEAMRKQKKIAKQGVTEAFEDAKSREALIPKNVVNDFRKNARELLKDFDVESETMTVVKRRLKELDEIDKLPDQSFIKIQAMESWRKRINANMPKDGGPAQAALTRLKKEYDATLDNAIDNALLVGDEEAIKAWRRARSRNVDFKTKFTDDKIIKTLVENDVTPEEAANYLFSANNLNPRNGSVKALRTIKSVLGEDSKEWNAVREEAFLRLFDNQPTDGFSAQKFVTSLDNVLKKNPTLMKELFSNDEIRRFQRLRNVAASTIRDKKSTNPSGSGEAIIRAVRDLFGPVGRVTADATKRILSPLSQSTGRREALELGVDQLEIKKLFPPGLVGGLSATIGTQGQPSGQESP